MTTLDRCPWCHESDRPSRFRCADPFHKEQPEVGRMADVQRAITELREHIAACRHSAGATTYCNPKMADVETVLDALEAKQTLAAVEASLTE